MVFECDKRGDQMCCVRRAGGRLHRDRVKTYWRRRSRPSSTWASFLCHFCRRSYDALNVHTAFRCHSVIPHDNKRPAIAGACLECENVAKQRKKLNRSHHNSGHNCDKTANAVQSLRPYCTPGAHRFGNTNCYIGRSVEQKTHAHDIVSTDDRRAPTTQKHI